MTTALHWIGSLPSLLQAELDRAVTAELHAIVSDICRSRISKPAGHAANDVSACGQADAQAIAESSTASGQIAA
jgi:hypothetical protein